MVVPNYESPFEIELGIRREFFLERTRVLCFRIILAPSKYGTVPEHLEEHEYFKDI